MYIPSMLLSMLLLALGGAFGLGGVLCDLFIVGPKTRSDKGFFSCLTLALACFAAGVWNLL